MEKDIFKSLKEYMRGFMGSSRTTQEEIDCYTKVIEELKNEILKDPNKAPEIIHARKQQAEIENLRLRFTKHKGYARPRFDIEVVAIEHVTWALTDSKPLGGVK